jgi:hypothetical protein
MGMNQEDIIQKYTGMGFDMNLVLQAMVECKSEESKMMDTLFALTYSSKHPIFNF